MRLVTTIYIVLIGCIAFSLTSAEALLPHFTGKDYALCDSIVPSDNPITEGAGSSSIADSINTQNPDSTVVEVEEIPLNIAEGALDESVNYDAKDSIIYDIVNQKIYLYGKASVSQDKIKLSAAQIVLDQQAKIMKANGRIDSTGTLVERPVFTEGNRSFESDEIVYNFETKKGRLSQIVTQEGEGYLRGKSVKKNERDELFAQDAFYTTCNLEHPHFKIAVDKVKVVPNKLIVSGPAQLIIEDVPTPLVLPFGIFPIQKTRTSGVLLPSYGYSPRRGYYFQGGGYYFGVSDLFDLAITGDIYTNGSWRLNTASNYRKRYKYNGLVSLDFGRSRDGDPITPDFEVRDNFFIRWNHNQDAKARPNSTFKANVSFGSSGFNKEYGISNSTVLTNTFTSSINYNQKLVGTPFNYTIGARHEQNTNTNIVNLTLPTFKLNMTRIQPFKRKVQIGQKKWYEEIGLAYNMDAQARVSIADSLLFTNEIFDNLKYGINHTPSLSTNFRILKYINVNPNINYSEAWYFQTIDKAYAVNYDDEGVAVDTTIQTIKNEGFKRAMRFNGGVNFSTILYGMFNFKKGKVKAIRHELKPTLGFTARPDFAKNPWNYYQYVKDINGNVHPDSTRFSIFEGGIYGSPPQGSQAAISYGFGNNLQMKVRPNASDTSRLDKKINLIDRLQVSSSYNFLADSLKMSNITINGGTNLFKKINVTYNSTFDPYITDDDNRRLNTYEWKENKRLARFKTASVSLRSSFSSEKGRNSSGGGNVRQFNANDRNTNTNAPREQVEEINNFPDLYEDWNIPWDINVDYNLRLNKSKRDGQDTVTVTQTIGLRGSVNLTPKWRVAVNTGYDITKRSMARTTIDIYRDLHCWEMSFSISPVGAYQNYSFKLNVKSQVLQDLKLTRRRSWQDL